MCSSSVSLGRNLVSLKWEDFNMFVVSELAALYQKDDLTDVTLFCEGRSFRAHKVLLSREDFNMFVVSELAALYQKDDLTDVTLFCEGRSFRAHKVLLSLWSSYFREIFRSTSHSHPVVILRETNSVDLELILRFIYQGHLLIPIEDTDRFLKTAEHLQVAGLKNMRNHIPNFNYSSSSSGSGGTSEDATGNIMTTAKVVESTPPPHAPPPQHQVQHATVYDGAPASSASPQVIYSSSTSSSSSSHASGAPPPPPPHMASPAPEAHSLHHQYLSPESSSNQHQQVIRQGGSASTSNRSGKHSAPATAVTYAPQQQHASPQVTMAFQAATPVETSSGRAAAESVIFQQQGTQQPMLIFQNGPVARGGSSTGRVEHTGQVVVIEGVVTEPSVHHESSNNHGTGSAPAYTVYTSSSVGVPSGSLQPPHHINSHHTAFIEAPGDNDDDMVHREDPVTKKEHSSHQQHPHYQQHHSHHQSSSYQQAEVAAHHDHGVVEMDTGSSGGAHILPHSYNPSPPTSTIIVGHDGGSQNGGISPPTSFPGIQQKSKSVVVEQPAPPPPPVYAVKRIPPLIPPSPPPSSSSSASRASFKNSTTSPSIKKEAGNFQQEGTCIATRSKANLSGGAKVLSRTTTPQMTPPSARNLKEDHGNKRGGSCSSSSSSSSFTSTPTSTTTSVHTSGTPRKVVLVPCPKCGKKVKQTSLKVHMKRSHLEEGTVLVCPICSKRISSKGVYYKHMYIHRKRSETPGRSPTGQSAAAANTASSTHSIKSEPQGT